VAPKRAVGFSTVATTFRPLLVPQQIVGRSGYFFDSRFGIYIQHDFALLKKLEYRRRFDILHRNKFQPTCETGRNYKCSNNGALPGGPLPADLGDAVEWPSG